MVQPKAMFRAFTVSANVCSQEVVPSDAVIESTFSRNMRDAAMTYVDQFLPGYDFVSEVHFTLNRVRWTFVHQAKGWAAYIYVTEASWPTSTYLTETP